MPHLVEESESSNGIIDTCINFLVIYGLSLCVTRYGWSNSMEKCIKKHILANPTFWHLHTNVSNVSSFTPWYLSCLFMNLCLVFQRSSATDLPSASVIRFLSTLPVVLHHARLSDIWAQRADILTQKSLCWSDASWVWHCLVCNCGKGREEAATRDNCTPPRPAPATPLWSSTKVKVQISNTFDHEPSRGPSCVLTDMGWRAKISPAGNRPVWQGLKRASWGTSLPFCKCAAFIHLEKWGPRDICPDTSTQLRTFEDPGYWLKDPETSFLLKRKMPTSGSNGLDISIYAKNAHTGKDMFFKTSQVKRRGFFCSDMT